MERRVSYGFNSLMGFLHVVTCVVSIAMLLSFPASKVHNFGTHFRTPEVRRAIERHTSVSHSDDNALDRVAQSDPLPTFFTPPETASKIVPLGNFESPSEVPLARLLNRRKLNPSGSGGQDPLLQA